MSLRYTLLTSLLLLSLSSNSSYAQVDNKQQLDLEQVQRQLAIKEKLLKTQQQQRKKLASTLKKSELAIAKSANNLHQTRQALTKNNQQQSQLMIDKVLLAKRYAQQQKALAKQLTSAYMVGGNDLVKLLLNQQNSRKVERLLGYYKYINQARLDSLEQLKHTLTKLTSIEQQLNQSALELASLKQQQQQEQSKFKRDKIARNIALNKLNKQYINNSINIEQLQLSENDLAQLLKQAAAVVTKQKKLSGLAKFKGRLHQPSQGKISNLFGKIRSVPVRWKGITINGKEGQSVNAVHHGKVLFADWIKGFGLVIVIDHGKGYMSLYGHNQALLKNAGEYVSAQEQIALLGKSGGQARPKLYFELRHKGKAINPKSWLKS